MATTNPHTLIAVAIFASWYLLHTAIKTGRQQLDLYDLAMLSMVAIIPAAFTFIPSLADRLARIFGVAFPFVAMFGMLFAILFIFVHRLTVKLHRLERDNRLLIQELSLLKHSLDRPDPQP
jgi:hypothetical protein